MPSLYIIAGPNGAGKSTFSAGLVPSGITIFDGDKMLRELERKFPSVDVGDLMQYVRSDMFPCAKEDAIKNQRDFAFESNFAVEQIMKTVADFKKMGYQTNLFFVGLSSCRYATERVAMRVLEGGHDVSNDEIRSNYENGLHNLKRFSKDFDRVIILDNSHKSKLLPPKILYKLEKGVILEQASSMSAWAKNILVVEESSPSVQESPSRRHGKRI